MKKNNYYFIENSTDNDLIGFTSYSNALKVAIQNGSNFIGLIADFGTGKSSLIKMLAKTNNVPNTKKENNYKTKIITINLWNCNNKHEENELQIHRVFLHQLIDKLDIKNKNYYKKKINKNYSTFDIESKKTGYFYAFFLFIYYLMCIFDKVGFIKLFNSELIKTFVYLLISILTFLCIKIYKPLLSFNRQDTKRNIDENDTKDLYNEIIKDYISHSGQKYDKTIICLEELDRYDNSEVVISYLKEFYKFYKLSHENEKIVFIIALRPSDKYNHIEEERKYNEVEIGIKDKGKISIESGEDSQIITKSSKYGARTSEQIKDTYEKVFDFILNLNRVNIQDFDSIVIKLLKEKGDNIPKDIPKPTINNLGNWRYLFLGKDITIRDIKHRYNFAISLYDSVKHSGVKKVDINKCLYLSYLEDEYNYLYNKLIVNNNLINNILIEYTKDKQLSNIKDLDKDEKQIIINSIEKQYIDVDYMYYFFKYPKGKQTFNIYELNVYNAVFFDKDNDQLKASLNELKDKNISKLLKKRVDKDYFPDIIFGYSKLIKVAYNYNKKVFINTLENQYDLIDNFEKFKNVVNRLYSVKGSLFREIFEEYFNVKLEKLKNVSYEDRKSIRLKLVELFTTDSTLFKDIFFGDNDLISVQEMKCIGNLEIIYELTNPDKINDIYIDECKNYINTLSKTKIILLLNKISKIESIVNEWYKEIFYSIDFKKITINELNIRNIYSYSKDKLNLNELNNLHEFILKLDNYSQFLDNKYLSLLDEKNEEQVQKYIDICDKYMFISKYGLDKINKCPKKFELNDKMLQKMFENDHYYTYVASNTISKNKLYIEKEKFEKLEESYKEYFIASNLDYDVTDEMVHFLYKNVDITKLSTDKLKLFSKERQNDSIISTVLNTNDSEFINDYLMEINKISNKDRGLIFKKFGNLFKNNVLKKKTTMHLKDLAKTEKEKDLLDGRKNKKNPIVAVS